MIHFKSAVLQVLFFLPLDLSFLACSSLMVRNFFILVSTSCGRSHNLRVLITCGIMSSSTFDGGCMGE